TPIHHQHNRTTQGTDADTKYSDSTRNANSYFSAFTNAAHSNRAAFFFPATSILFCVPAPDFAMFFCPAH
ncbi:hypothetical protein, partial [Escherichia coli]|uniref:hypothetical protein n=1 Tax=Escherichia coli TaxID=562 RepID=UPI001BA54170